MKTQLSPNVLALIAFVQEGVLKRCFALNNSTYYHLCVILSDRSALIIRIDCI